MATNIAEIDDATTLHGFLSAVRSHFGTAHTLAVFDGTDLPYEAETGPVPEEDVFVEIQDLNGSNYVCRVNPDGTLGPRIT